MEKLGVFVKAAASMLIIISLLKNLLPGKKYEKFFNAYIGMLFILILLSSLSDQDIISFLTTQDFSLLAMDEPGIDKSNTAYACNEMNNSMIQSIISGQIKDLLNEYNVDVVSVDTRATYDKSRQIIEVKEICISCKGLIDDSKKEIINQRLQEMLGTDSISYLFEEGSYGAK